jgi:hypothetical protein
MESFHLDDESFSRVARHGRLLRLYRLIGDETMAREHLQAIQRMMPHEDELAVRWMELFGVPGR